ncbi:DegT/DnrJ/EryC1/StrS family aminotransferase [bacterium]|nr:DegT/DnrJ/EryC1/StrS family aminotransferase [bacterium]
MAERTSKEASGLPISRFDLSLNFTDIQWAFGEVNNAREQEIEKFEEEFAAFIGVKKAIYMASARAGLYLVLQSLNLAPRSRVLIPAWTHHSIPAAIIAAGLQPCLVDIRKKTWTMAPELISEDDWDGVSVIIITHMYGCPAPAPELLAEAKKRNIFVIEDCAQGFGAEIDGKKAGSFGDAAIFSFALTKNFTTLGGGMVVFQNEKIGSTCAQLMQDAKITANTSMYPTLLKAAAMWVGTSKFGFLLGPYPFLALGWTFQGRDMLHEGFREEVNTSIPDIHRKPSPLQAALGRRLLKWSVEQNEYRTKNGLKLIELFEKEHIPNLSFSGAPNYGTSVFMSFVINYENSEKLGKQLFNKGIDTSPGYLAPVHQQPIFAESCRYFGTLPNTNFLARTQLHIPVYPRLQEPDLRRIVAKCREAVEYVEHYYSDETKYRSLPSMEKEKALTDPDAAKASAKAEPPAESKNPNLQLMTGDKAAPASHKPASLHESQPLPINRVPPRLNRSASPSQPPAAPPAGRPGAHNSGEYPAAGTAVPSARPAGAVPPPPPRRIPTLNRASAPSADRGGLPQPPQRPTSLQSRLNRGDRE